MDRRNNDESEPSRRPSEPDVFDDENEIDPDEDDFMPSVSDGFRPTNASETWQSDRHDHNRMGTPQRQTSTSKPNSSDLRRTATRNSTAKVHDPIPQDGRSQYNQRIHQRSSLGHAHRDSVSSTASFATTSNSENPFETGPSHPYGMYPQLSMARPLSVATSSTERQPHRSLSLQRPAHPYAMYSQSGIVDEESAEEPAQPPVPQVQTAIPVGFPGLSNGYRRVLGPDGEEQDIIGPDGHTEQLPPYSRYPEEGPTKASLAAEASASRVVPAPAQVDPEDPFNTPPSPVSPLGSTSFSSFNLPAPATASAPLLPSVTPARLPPQRPETQTGNAAPTTSISQPRENTIPAEPSDSSSASLLTNENHFSEKAELAEDKKIKWHKRKLWGKVPMGVAVGILILILIFAVALGAAIGTFATKKQITDENEEEHRHPHEEAQPQVTGQNGSLFDAVPIAAPSGMAPIPTGPFALPMGIPQDSSPGCLTQANQFSAWSCKMTFAPLVITVNETTVDGDTVQVASMGAGPSVPKNAILYGLQTPVLDTKPLDLVLDLDYKSYGPAYHFSARYDKLVILPPEQLNLGSAIAPRQDVKYRQRFEVKPGDYPWYCYWNDTYIEGYIYVQDNSTAASFTSFPTEWPTPSASTLSTAAVNAMTVTATTTDTVSVDIIESATPTATPSPVRNKPRNASPDDPPARMPPYPRTVKIEERRLANSPQPYCQQMVLLDNGQITTAPGPNDSPIRIWLQESDPSYEEFIAAQPSSTDTPHSKNKRQDSAQMQRRLDPSDACHCQWMFS